MSFCTCGWERQEVRRSFVFLKSKRAHLMCLRAVISQKFSKYHDKPHDRILFATRYARFLDQNGFLRFQNWKLYGERGLGSAPVTVWVYEGTLKIEHKAMTLSK